MIHNIAEILARSGFYISDSEHLHSISFDIICRRDNTLLIFKVLTNIDSFTKENANQLNLLASFLDAGPVMIGHRSSSGPLEDGIIYLRHLISIITAKTLYDIFIEGIFPSVFAAPGGFYVNLDTGVLRSIRQERKMSLGDLAKSIGVSRKAIQMYEQGMSASLEVGLVMEETLGIPLIMSLDPFVLNEELLDHREKMEQIDEVNRSLRNKLHLLGYEVIPLFRCPFDAFTLDDHILLITGFQKRSKGFFKKARLMANIASITERQSVFFVSDPTSKMNIEGTPIITEGELEKIDCSEEIMELVYERRGKVGRR